jgi:hypothetical protein
LVGGNAFAFKFSIDGWDENIEKKLFLNIESSTLKTFSVKPDGCSIFGDPSSNCQSYGHVIRSEPNRRFSFFIPLRLKNKEDQTRTFGQTSSIICTYTYHFYQQPAYLLLDGILQKKLFLSSFKHIYVH